MERNRHSLWNILTPTSALTNSEPSTEWDGIKTPKAQRTVNTRSIQAIALEDCYEIETTTTPISSVHKMHRADLFIEPPKSKTISASKIKMGIGRRCSVSECTSMARSRGLCTAHGGGKKCLTKDCSNIAQSRGFCRSHGGGSRCKAEGCPRSAQSRGLCRKHGGGQICRIDKCSSSVLSGGLCRAHGGGKSCSVSGCTSIAQILGLCRSHSEAKQCQVTNCSYYSRRGKSFCQAHINGNLPTVIPIAATTTKCSKIQNLAGLCRILADESAPCNNIGEPQTEPSKLIETEPKQSSKKRKCQEIGCTSNAQSRGLCRAHGGGSRCRVEGCKSSAQSGGLCRSHGGGKSCQVHRCPRNAKSGGLCISHGGGKRCKVPECTRSVQSRGVCKAHGARAQNRLQLLCGVACS